MTLSDFTNIVVAATSIVAIILGIASFWHQNRQARQFLGIQILREWEHSFYSSDEMRRKRYITCLHFKERKSGNLPLEAWEILDAFDSIGIYVNKGIVDKELAWTGFYYWLNPYWHLLHGQIQELQTYTDGVPYLKNVEDMYTSLTAFGVRYRNLPRDSRLCSPSKIEDFLDDEIKATWDERWA